MRCARRTLVFGKASPTINQAFSSTSPRGVTVVKRQARQARHLGGADVAVAPPSGIELAKNFQRARPADRLRSSTLNTRGWASIAVCTYSSRLLSGLGHEDTEEDNGE